eukprot:SAG31_NODE_37_length_31616_cov_38.688359_2_plen_157_part_00
MLHDRWQSLNEECETRSCAPAVVVFLAAIDCRPIEKCSEKLKKRSESIETKSLWLNASLVGNNEDGPIEYLFAPVAERVGPWLVPRAEAGFGTVRLPCWASSDGAVLSEFGIQCESNTTGLWSVPSRHAVVYRYVSACNRCICVKLMILLSHLQWV